MSSDRWSEVKRLFDAAAERPPAEREAFLRHSCGGDAALRAEVESLLEAHRNLDSRFLERPAVAVLVPGTNTLPLQRLGPYRLLREIGHGGMGTVFLAWRDDDQFQKLVAVKLVRGGIRSAFLLRRFRNERQFLAALEHPNIARLLDGGTTGDGVPYLVMEYVEGEPIHRYCERRDLTLRQKLELFAVVCDAVDYAHRNLIVHRDIKPANVLINEDGVPKLLDFGIAKLVTSDEPADPDTATDWRVLTPEYASPEHIRGGRVSTSSDVYSLGVLLYEILTGRRPFEAGEYGRHELTRAICEKEPLPPSRAASDEKLCRRLRGDLDNIVLRALRKDPEQRYASVAQFADDIRRHLDQRPVLARKPSAWYRASRFVARNRVAVAMSATAIAALVLTTGVAVRQRLRAEEEARVASARFDDLRSLANAFLLDLYEEMERLPGSLQARQTIVARSLRHLDRLRVEAQGNAELLADIAAGYERLGSITYGVEATERNQRSAVDINEWLVRRHPSNVRYRMQLSSSLASLGNCLKLKGDTRGELASYERSLHIADGLAASHPSNRDYQLHLSNVLLEAGNAFARQQRMDEALVHQRRALAIARALGSRRDTVIALHVLSTNLIATGQLDEALHNYEEALSIAASLASNDPANNHYRRDLWFVHRQLGTIRSLRGGHDAALRHLRTALDLKRQLIEADPLDGGHRRGFAITHLALGRALEAAGRPAEALAAYEEALRIGEPLLRDDPRNRETWDDVAEEFATLRALLRNLGDDDRLAAIREREVALYRSVLESDRANAVAQGALARATAGGSE